MTESVKLREEARKKASIAIFGPIIGAVIASLMCYRWGGISRFDIILFCVSSFLATLGITAGYHRLFAHKSYKSARWIKLLFGILGATAGQGPIMFWSSVHRRHHRHADQVGDPHSPHAGMREGEKASIVKAHIGWMLEGKETIELHRIRDLAIDHDVRFIDRNYSVWLFISFLIPAVLGFWYWSRPIGLVQGMLFGGFLRIIFVQNIIWAGNSIGHTWGAKSCQTKDESRNNFFLGLLLLGEGFHNNHHFKPNSPRVGLAWWELDVTYIVIASLARIGAVKDMERIPTFAQSRSKNGQT